MSIARGDVSPGSAQTNILDNFVWEDHGVQSSTGLRLYIGSRSGYTARTYIQFATMPTIPSGSTITAATMKLTMVSGTSLAYTANAYQVTGGEWDPTTIQWTNKPAANVLLQSNISNNDRTKYQFSVLTAVRHWYDGDPTGQNENYGIMLRYYDETLTGYYNSVYSGDVVDTNSRPKLTISYTPPSTTYIVDMGGTKTLTVSGVSDTITWTSENPTVATVNASGVVTGVSLGTATINASVGDTVYKTFTIRVIIKEGVYYIKNVGTGTYVGTESGASENTPVKLLAKATSADARLQQLWRIKHLGNGYYSICLLHKLNMGLHANGNAGSSVDVVDIGFNSQLYETPSLSCWGISTTSDGRYYLEHVAVGGLKMYAVEDAVNSVMVGNESSTSNSTKWELELVEGVFLYKIDANEQVSIPLTPLTISEFLGMSYSLFQYDMGVIISCGPNENPTIQWDSNLPSIVSINSQTGRFTVNSIGTATITGQCVIGNTTHTVQYLVRVRRAHSLGGEFSNGEDAIEAAETWETCGYASVYNISPTITTLNEANLNWDILYFSTHGNQHSIQFENDMLLTDGSDSGATVSQSIRNLSLDNALLCIYDACLTASDGDGTGKNLCTATIDSGADCVIGWTMSIGVDDAREWQKRFQAKLIEGYTVIGAANYANTFQYSNNEKIKSWRIYGNSNLIITTGAIAGTTSDEDYIDIAASRYTGEKYSDGVAIQVIQSCFPEIKLADTDSYTISKTYTSDDEENYVVDYVVHRGQYSLDVGYSILVEDGEIIGIRNNMGDYSAPERSALAFDTVDLEETRARAYEEAVLQVYKMSPDYSVVSQTDELYYDCTTATRYCKVFTVYETENGAVGAFTTLYPIDAGGSYEK